MLIAFLFVAAMASPAIVAVRYTAKPKRELTLSNGQARRLARSIEGSVIVSVRVAESASTTLGPRLLTQGTHNSQLPVNASDRQA